VAVSGISTVTVVNPAPGGGTSSSATLNIDCLPIQVSIDSQSPTLAILNKNVFGANLASSMDLTNGTGTFYNTMIATFQKAHFGMVRWPLALLSDYYHWQTNSFSSCASALPNGSCSLHRMPRRTACSPKEGY
jgi:hypothetical protein